MYRRDFLLAMAAASLRADTKPFRGIFPIAQTPYTDSNQLDLPTLAKEVRFLDECGVNGVVWPQLASEWSELSIDERLSGAETIMSAAKGLRIAVVLGVQGADVPTAVRYAKHADGLKPDAIIAIPPRDPKLVPEYYEAIAGACLHPLIVQAIGDISVEQIVTMSKRIPTLRYVKDEAGHTLSRISRFRAVAPDLGVFTGAHGRTLLDEMSRGAAGSMPAAGFADLYVKVWTQWHTGKKQQAMDTFGRVSLLVHQMQAWGLPALKYILHLRGVFPNWRCRGGAESHFDAKAERSVKETWEWAKAVA